MEALQTVFDYIRAILEIIKGFFAEIFPQEDNATEEDEATDILK